MSSEKWAAEAQAAGASKRSATPFIIFGVVGCLGLLACSAAGVVVFALARPSAAYNQAESEMTEAVARDLLALVVAVDGQENADGRQALKMSQISKHSIRLAQLDDLGYDWSFETEGADWSLKVSPKDSLLQDVGLYFIASRGEVRESRGEWPK